MFYTICKATQQNRTHRHFDSAGTSRGAEVRAPCLRGNSGGEVRASALAEASADYVHLVTGQLKYAKGETAYQKLIIIR